MSLFHARAAVKWRRIKGTDQKFSVSFHWQHFSVHFTEVYVTAKQWKKLTLLHIIANVSRLCPGCRREEKERGLNLDFLFFRRA